MSKDEVKTIADALVRKYAERDQLNIKIKGLEIAYEALAGQKYNGNNGTAKTITSAAPVRRSRKGVMIDRQGARKTYEFIRERGDKPTTVKMIARKFGITVEAASQRIQKLYKNSQIVRVSVGHYLASNVVVPNTPTETPNPTPSAPSTGA